MSTTAPTKARRRTLAVSRVVSMVGALLLASAFLVVGGASSPASAAVTNQCNNILNEGGRGLECEITVENFLNLATGAESSRVTTLACSGAANENPLPTCVGPTVTEFQELTTEANQCNGTNNGGGSTMRCVLTVVTTITGNATTSIAPVNQCNGSLDTGDVRLCDPDPATEDASIDGVTQCNGSVNGGGGSMTCTVSPSTTSNSAFAFLANQCNGSANGGGETIVCEVDISNVIAPAGGIPAPDELADTGAERSLLLPAGAAAITLLMGVLLLARTASRRPTTLV